MTSCDYSETHDLPISKNIDHHAADTSSEEDLKQVPSNELVIEDGNELPSSVGCPGMPVVFNALLESSPEWLRSSIIKAGPTAEWVKKISIWVSEETVRLADGAERAIGYVISETIRGNNNNNNNVNPRNTAAAKTVRQKNVNRSSKHDGPGHDADSTRMKDTSISRPNDPLYTDNQTVPEWRKIVKATAKKLINKGFQALGVEGSPPSSIPTPRYTHNMTRYGPANDDEEHGSTYEAQLGEDDEDFDDGLADTVAYHHQYSDDVE